MGLADDTKEDGLDSVISCWSDEDEMTMLERTQHRDYLIRMQLDIQGCPTFVTKVLFINILELSFYYLFRIQL